MNLELKLFRKYLLSEYTIGKLSNEDIYLCDTLEDKIRDLQDYNHDNDFDDSGEGKVYGRTAIPAGRYQIKFTYSMKLKRSLPILLNVVGFSGIRIHGGKDANWSEGCILVGENKVKGGLINYKYWETTIGNMVKDSINSGNKVFLTIKQ
jgi:hypothetical protein